MTFFNTFQPFRFSSEYYDSELGLIAYNYRHYNPIDGRFLSRDPIGESGGYNLYAFCNNDPINHTDHLGMKFKPTEESKGKTRRVYVSDQKNGESKKNLADIIKLDYSEFDKWAAYVIYPKSKNKNSLDICSASVPNVGYIDITTYTYPMLLHVLVDYHVSVRNQWESEGLKVNNSYYGISLESQIPASIKSHFNSPNIYKYMFIGHGNSGAIVLTENIALVPIDVNMNHRISEMRIIACYANDGAPAWRELVSEFGNVYLGNEKVSAFNFDIKKY